MRIDGLKDRVAKIASKPLGCAHDEVAVREVSIPWIRRMRPFLTRGGTEHAAGLLVVMPNGAVTPPLLLAALPVWEQHWSANAVLREEGIALRSFAPEAVAEICRTTLAGPGSRVASITLARRELRDPARYDYVAPYLEDALFQPRERARWYARFMSVTHDGAVERWQVAGYEDAISQAECELIFPSGTWPEPRY